MPAPSLDLTRKPREPAYAIVKPLALDMLPAERSPEKWPMSWSLPRCSTSTDRGPGSPRGRPPAPGPLAEVALALALGLVEPMPNERHRARERAEQAAELATTVGVKETAT